jgi:hypothetical protein
MKSLTVLLVVCALGVAAGSGTTAATSRGTRLRIESFSDRQLPVEIVSAPAGLWLDSASADSVTGSLRTVTPVALFIADSVQSLRVVVIGNGSVKLFFDTLAVSRKGPIWGRDVRLRRVDGRFQPTTQIIPLNP